jgi:hypothetical protein
VESRQHVTSTQAVWGRLSKRLKLPSSGDRVWFGVRGVTVLGPGMAEKLPLLPPDDRI